MTYTPTTTDHERRSLAARSGGLGRAVTADLHAAEHALSESERALAEERQHRHGHLPTCNGLDEVERRCDCGYLQGEAYRDLITALAESESAFAQVIRLQCAHPGAGQCAKAWEADHQRAALEQLGLDEEFPFDCDAIEHVGEALIEARARLAAVEAAARAFDSAVNSYLATCVQSGPTSGAFFDVVRDYRTALHAALSASPAPATEGCWTTDEPEPGKWYWLESGADRALGIVNAEGRTVFVRVPGSVTAPLQWAEITGSSWRRWSSPIPPPASETEAAP